MVKPRSCDVAVVGAGPAGLVAARDLARRGRDVVVLEEHDSIGHPVHCTGLVGLDAFQELELSHESVCTVVASAAFQLNHGAPLIVRSERLRAAVIDRAVFDLRLGQEAGASGAEIRPGCRVRHIHVARDRVDLHLQDGERLRAAAVVLACGANYRFNRALGLGVPRAFLQAAQVEIPARLAEQVTVYFGAQIAPEGFGWVVPFTRNGVEFSRLGLMCRDRVSPRFEAFKNAVGSVAEVSTGAWPQPLVRLLPLAPVRTTVATRVVAVGDAAGLVKPTTGGGIYYSLLSGAMAAQVLHARLSNGRLAAEDLRAYEDRWRDRMGAEIRIGLAFRALAARLSDRGIDALIELARVDGVLPLLHDHADFNWHRGAALALLRHPSFRRIVVSHLWT